LTQINKNKTNRQTKQTKTKQNNQTKQQNNKQNNKIPKITNIKSALNAYLSWWAPINHHARPLVATNIIKETPEMPGTFLHPKPGFE